MYNTMITWFALYFEEKNKFSIDNMGLISAKHVWVLMVFMAKVAKELHGAQ